MITRILALAVLVLGLAAAADKGPPAAGPFDEKLGATATMKDSAGNTVGQVTFFQAGDGVLLRASLNRLPPDEHAFHIHETGKCDAPDFKSAGGHFNPTKASHGYLSGKDHHAGDMPNFQVSPDGRATFDVFNDALTLDGQAKSGLFKSGGAAVVIHSGRDDYQSQPSGDAGSRIACGVIQKAQ